MPGPLMPGLHPEGNDAHVCDSLPTRVGLSRKLEEVKAENAGSKMYLLSVYRMQLARASTLPLPS